MVAAAVEFVVVAVLVAAAVAAVDRRTAERSVHSIGIAAAQSPSVWDRATREKEREREMNFNFLCGHSQHIRL